MAWQRKHRPKMISELHLTSVREALLQLLNAPSFPQVFLFAGPKGTGKTSASRILGALLNDPKNGPAVDALFFKKPLKKQGALQEPDPDSDFSQRVYEGSSFVVQEMDAASHRGIDDVRSLKERAMLPPQEGKVTVYILDEAHMLTTEAFNALLKLLEEPPAHAVFILATTELHKIPETIISRSRLVAFRKASDDELTQALESVLKKEAVTTEAGALAEVVARADGSFRDGVKLLESLVVDGTLTVESVEKGLGKSVRPLLEELLQNVLAKDAAKVSSGIQDLRQRQTVETYAYKTLFGILHSSLLMDLKVIEGKPLFSQKVARFLLQELLQAGLEKYSPVPFLTLELKLLELIERAVQKSSGNDGSAKKKMIEPDLGAVFTEKSSKSASSQSLSQVSSKEEILVEKEIEPQENISEISLPEPLSRLESPLSRLESPLSVEMKDLGKTLMEKWDQFLKIVQLKNATVAALLRSSHPSISEEGIPEVSVYYKFHQEQLQQQKYMTLLSDCVRDLVGSALPLQVALRATPSTAQLVEIPNAPQQLSQLAEEALM